MHSINRERNYVLLEVLEELCLIPLYNFYTAIERKPCFVFMKALHGFLNCFLHA